MASKPRVLVLGGVGFVGRNFVRYLVEKDLASKIRVVDKVLPETACFSAEDRAAFSNPIVEFKQGNLASAASVAKVFTDESGDYNFVFNLAGETKYGQNDEVYEEKVVKCTRLCAEEAVKHNCQRFVEVSDARLYDADHKETKEEGKVKPWTRLAHAKHIAEQELAKVAGLNYVVLRPAIIYGPGDTAGISPRIICGAVYRKLNETMKFLWTKDLRINTVHVRDVCKALWHVSSNGNSGSVYNLADKGKTDQGKINDILQTIFGIKTGFVNLMMCQAAKLNMEYTTEHTNEKHLQPWSDLCKEHGIISTPLTPYLDQELLYDNHLSLDGSKIEGTGFTYDYPEITVDLVREQIAYFVAQKLFPSII
eukprot:TRINITY_DN1103_c0_g1_i1.p1 TRINITY_DN1103_c0_g1~~TRINITY_DN1103_c0_g1_i1.p1  ORF type:complete len:366 (-),score=106.39 TRINITY_DN1103_c0_g1_i1:222-1319(-)